ncbi:response regulator [Trinickia terrae]|uniref:Response regulator n=1 Tax=Trinickia terrae TaxID=2571161 RepID=A0A4U1IDF1_9BURK|nr:response regulator [Trinickia terrae]TKC91661.1 response regulator [Trinickia terrae]
MKSLLRAIRWTARTVQHAPPRACHRLLVVDDYRPGAEALTAALSLAGYDAQCVLDGSAVLQTVAARMPDIVILDVNMPGMDGYAVARLLRQDVTTQHLVIVAFTAQDESTVRTNGVAAGFDAYCQKGAAPEPLLRLLEEIT